MTYIVIWTDNKYGKRHSERHDDIVGVRRAMKELMEMHAYDVTVTKTDSPEPTEQEKRIQSTNEQSTNEETK